MKLTKAKEDAVASINNLRGLTNEQKAKENQAVNDAETRDQVANVLRDSKALDQSMQTLRDLVNSQNQVQSTSDYINEDQTQKILIIMRLILVNQSLVVNITQR